MFTWKSSEGREHAGFAERQSGSPEAVNVVLPVSWAS